MKRRVVIIGGGIAGMAAALRVAEAGDLPIVIETRKRLGGRATSFRDPRNDQLLDNCQHVMMGCCTNLMDFYERLGVGDSFEWYTETYWANPPHEPDVMRPGLLPAPAHFTGSFLRMRFLDLKMKRQIARAMHRMIRIGLTGRGAYVDKTFLEFLQETGQSEEVIDLFWRVVVVSACNLDVDQVGASFAMQVFQEGFLGHPFASAAGLSRIPLEHLYDPFESVLEKVGGSLHLGTSAMGIAFDGARVTGVVTSDGVIDGSAVISSVPFDRLARLCSTAMVDADSRLRKLDSIEVSPILGVHLFFDARIMTLPHLVLPGRSTHWLFNKGVDADGRQHVHAVISGADSWMSLSESEIVERVLEDIHWALPASQGLEPSACRSVKEKRATFRAVPGLDRIRPAAESGLGIPNLAIAGDWADTGWPATMEGAVRSGYRAAAAVSDSDGLVPDLPLSFGARMLGLR